MYLKYKNVKFKQKVFKNMNIEKEVKSKVDI